MTGAEGAVGAVISIAALHVLMLGCARRILGPGEDWRLFKSGYLYGMAWPLSTLWRRWRR